MNNTLKKRVTVISSCKSCQYYSSIKLTQIYDFDQYYVSCTRANKELKIETGKRFPDWCPLEDVATNDVRDLMINCGSLCPFFSNANSYKICDLEEKILKAKDINSNPDIPRKSTKIFPKWCPLLRKGAKAAGK